MGTDIELNLILHDDGLIFRVRAYTDIIINAGTHLDFFIPTEVMHAHMQSLLDVSPSPAGKEERACQSKAP